MSLRGEDALILAMDYTEQTLKGQGALKGEDGISPTISVNTSTSDVYKLDITDKNGTITTPNLVGKQGERGEVGETGADGETPTITENADNTEEVYKLDFTTKNGTFTTKNIIGKQGLEGVSPTVTTNPDNTTEDYRLNITTKGGSFTTPNLKGPQGERGPIGESAVSAINPRGDYDVNAEPTYTKSDYITYTDGNTYVCKLDNPTNEPPIDGTVTDTYWQVIAFRGAQGIAGKDGEKGADGVTFTPSIDANGVLSFTNNGGLENPEPIDIKGDNGVTFTPSIDADGYLSFTNNGNLENPEPIKVLGKDGVDGKDGADGTTYIPSIGTVTTVESNADASAGVTVDEETKEAVFNFAIPKGSKGADGVQISDVVSEDSTWSSKKINDSLVDIDSALENKANKTELNNYSYLGNRATRISENDDLNNYITPGIYTCSSISIAKTLLNLPTGIDSSFRLEVIINTGDETNLYGSQELRTNSNKIFIRTIRGTGGWTAWQELATMDKVALKQECFNKKVTLTDSNWKYETITFEKNYNNTPSINVSCGDYLNTKFYSYWGCEAYIININNKGCTIRYRSSKASESEPLEVNIIVFVNGI